MSLPSPSGSAGRRWAPTVELFALGITLIAGAALVGWVSWRVGSGYDFSDEGAYLNTIAGPGGYRVSVTQFGFVYHPLYQLVGGDVALLRRANLFITQALAWILCAVLLRKIVPPTGADGSGRGLPLAAVAFVLSTNSLALLDPWLPTPNYNSLALLALLLAGTGMLLAGAKSARTALGGWVLLGFSGALAFLAKPTTALALGIVTGLYLLLSGQMKIRLLAISLATAAILVLGAAWFIDGSVAAFALRLVNGVDDATILQGRHTLAEALRWDVIVLSPVEKGALAAGTLLVLLATCLGLSARPAQRVVGAVVALIFAVAGLLLATGTLFPNLSPTMFEGLQLWAAPCGALLAAVAVSWRNFPRLFSWDRLALAICFALFPHIYAFGTNRNYWVQTPEAAIFWVLAGVVFLSAIRGRDLSWRIFLPLVAGAQLATAALLFISMEHPYRQTQPLRQNEDVMHFAGTGASLRVPRGFADYVNHLQQLAGAAGFQAGTPVLDLTGHYPGALYALGAKSVGRPWMIGDYKGSDALAVVALDRVPRAELRNAWILTEPAGPRRLSLAILPRYGIDLAKDYVEVGSLDSPTGSYPDSYKQHLLKPVK